MTATMIAVSIGRVINWHNAIMRPRCCSRQVTMTIMVHAVVAFRVNDLWTFMKVQRRQHQHRQEYCQ